MASALARAKRTCRLSAAATMAIRRAFASVSVGFDIVSAAPNVALQKARTWDEGVSSNFSTTPVKEIFQVSRLSVFFHFIIRRSFICFFSYFINSDLLLCMPSVNFELL